MSVKHTSDQFMGAGERLHLQSWLPAGADPEQPPEPAAAIALVHGYGDHGGRHTWFGEDMAARGYAVYAYDLRGHGQSSGTRGQIRRFDDYLDDTAVFLDEVRRRQPGKPVVLLGHSLGGLICARFAQERPCDVRALVLSSPFFALTVQPEPMKVVGAKALSAVWPGRDIGNTVRAADLSHDQAVVDAYVTDPLVHHVATARWAAETLAAQDAAMAAAPSGHPAAAPAVRQGRPGRRPGVRGGLLRYGGVGGQEAHPLRGLLPRALQRGGPRAGLRGRRGLAGRAAAGPGGCVAGAAGKSRRSAGAAGLRRRPGLSGCSLQPSARGGWVECVSPGRPAVLM